MGSAPVSGQVALARPRHLRVKRGLACRALRWLLAGLLAAPLAGLPGGPATASGTDPISPGTPSSGSSAAAALAQRYGLPGPFASQVLDQVWVDERRQRDIPLRIRLPAGDGPYPVVLFSHGLGGSRQGGAHWGEQWASHGLAVIHLQHPGSDESLWRERPAGERMAGLRSGMSGEQFLARIADVRFVLDELARRQATGDARLRPLDLARVGMSGHSFGASTTLHLAGKRFAPAIERQVAQVAGSLAEARLSAFVAFSPQATGEALDEQFSQLRAPCLMFTGTLDGQPLPGIGVLPAQRLLPFEAMAPAGNKYLAVFEQADHMLLNGTPGLRDRGGPDRGALDAGAVEARVYPAIRAGSTAFWLAHLKQDPQAAAWLRDGGYASQVEPIGRWRSK